MLDDILEYAKKIFKSRLVPVFLIYTVLFLLLIQNLFTIQIRNSEEYDSDTTEVEESVREIKSTRGNFYDRNGELLAYNELCYNITYENTGELETSEEINAMIYRLLQILDKYGCELETEFYIDADENGELYFTVDGNTLLRFKKDAYSSETLTEEQENADAQTVYEFLRYDTSVNSPRFQITDEYSQEDALRILSIRFALFVNRYQENLPITISIASNVPMEVVAAVKENSPQLPGIEVTEETRRVYNYSEYFAHILGYTGLISQETLAEMKESGDLYYSATDQIGKTGLEKELEEELRGVKGSQTVVLNSKNNVTEIKDTVEAVAGNDVYLTIDAKLQKACYELLERRIAGVLISKIHSGSDSGSKGTSAGKITIPIYDVYFALINNNVIDINAFDKEGASSLEQSIHTQFLSKREDVLGKLSKYMKMNSTTRKKDVSDTMAEYLAHIYKVMGEDGVLNMDAVDREDSTYLRYTEDKISLSEFITYAFSNNWIDLTRLNVDTSYYDTEELYDLLMKYVWDLLYKNLEFSKMIYGDMIYSYELSGKNVCLLLYEQGVLKKDKNAIAKLKSGETSPYSFLVNKIKKLQITPAMLALEPCSGSVVVTDVKNGDVLAMVTYPSYDNNKMANVIDSDYFSKLNIDLSSPFYNKATQTKIAPGSTYKIVTSVAALEEGVVREGELIRDKTVYTNITPSPKCWVNPGNHGSVDITTAIEVSCNYFFYEMGYRLGSKGSGSYNSSRGLSYLMKYATMFGLNDKSGVEITEADPQVSDEEAVRSAIGQGTNAYTPVQLARYVTAVANSGTVYNLTLIQDIRDVNGNVIRENEAEVFNQIEISDSTWNLVHKGMNKVVNGSRSSIRSLFTQFDNTSVTIAGKTGTAQQNEYHPNHALFISYAPYENPEISVTSVIPNGYTSSNAAELTSYVYQYYYGIGDVDALLTGDATKPKSSASVD